MISVMYDYCYLFGMLLRTYLYLVMYAMFPVNEVRNMRRGGLLVFAPPCSSWVFLLLDFFIVLDIV